VESDSRTYLGLLDPSSFCTTSVPPRDYSTTSNHTGNAGEAGIAPNDGVKTLLMSTDHDPEIEIEVLKSDLLWVSYTCEARPTNVRSIREMMNQILCLCNLLEITRPPDSALECC
jgi:hypothetical protein